MIDCPSLFTIVENPAGALKNRGRRGAFSGPAVEIDGCEGREVCEGNERPARRIALNSPDFAFSFQKNLCHVS
jgi:hypothetical protein